MKQIQIFCRGEEIFIGEREVGDFRFLLVTLKHIDVDGHAQGVGIKPLDDDWKVEGVDGMDSWAALFKMFKKSGGEGVSVKCCGFAELTDPCVIDNGLDEGRGAADACIV